MLPSPPSLTSTTVLATKRAYTSTAGVTGAGLPAGSTVPLSAFAQQMHAELQEPAARRAYVAEVVREQVASRKDAFYVVDLAEIARKHKQWHTELPRVRPFYAVKCNDDPRIVETLAALGTGFDCASKGEMSMVLKAGVAPKDIIFAHPAKQVSHLHYARAKGVKRMTFDNEEELRKIAAEHPEAEVVLRILTDDSASVCRLGLKFGAPLSTVPKLLKLSQELKLQLVGVSYHVGSGNGSLQAFHDAVRDARSVFDSAAAMGLPPLRLLDIGGGYPGSELGATGAGDKRSDPVHTAAAAVLDSSANPYDKHPSFSNIAAVIRSALDKFFPEGCGVELISEPGRYFVKGSHVLAVNVVGKRVTADEDPSGKLTGEQRINYYINDGLYGSFNCILYDHVTCAPSMVLVPRHRAGSSLAHASAAAVAEDTVVRLAPDGSTAIVSDAVGLPHAAALASMVAAQRQALQQLQEEQQKLSMSMGGAGAGMLGGSSLSSDHSSSSSSYSSASAAEVVTSRAASATASLLHSSSTSSRLAAEDRVVPNSAGIAVTSPGAAAFALQSLEETAAAVAGAGAGPRLAPTTIWGPTCDSIDKISDTLRMPELQPGDWLLFENMGAYTIAGSCRFNGFPLATKVYIGLDKSVSVMQEEGTD